MSKSTISPQQFKDSLTRLLNKAKRIIYIGSEEMPEDSVIQIDPYGSPTEIVNGVTFFPSVSQEGDISWTNNGDMENPDPVNLLGPQGKSAYEVAKEKGFEGTVDEWLNSLVGTIVNIAEISATVDSSVGIPSVSVDISGTDTEKSIGFTFKNLKGDKGDKGDQGNKGDQGEIGLTPAIQIGQVDTLPPGTKSTVTMTGTQENPVMNLSLPRGYDGYTPMRGVDYYTNEDVQQLLTLISQHFLSGYKIQPVDSIPEVQDPDTIYIIMAKPQ